MTDPIVSNRNRPDPGSPWVGLGKGGSDSPGLIKNISK